MWLILIYRTYSNWDTQCEDNSLGVQYLEILEYEYIR